MAFLPPSLALAKAFVLAQLTVCQPIGLVPQVDIYFLADKPEYVTDAPVKVLTAETANNPDSTFATDSKWITFGITTGKMTDGGFSVSFRTVQDQQGDTCLNVSRVRIGLRYSPTIYIAKEIGGMDCQFKMVKLHEERHVATDLETIREYIPKVKMDILWYLRSLGPQGPYQGTDVEKQMHAINEQIAKAARPMLEKLYQVRRDRQGMIDSEENYKLESGLCPSDEKALEKIR